jgi:hypothetical protein
MNNFLICKIFLNIYNSYFFHNCVAYSLFLNVYNLPDLIFTGEQLPPPPVSYAYVSFYVVAKCRFGKVIFLHKCEEVTIQLHYRSVQTISFKILAFYISQLFLIYHSVMIVLLNMCSSRLY